MLVALQIVGSLSIFLFGMKLMSDALQKMAGGRLRGVLNSLTKSRIKSFLTGLGVTGLVQSSSATTVLSVGVVHAGLVSLKSVLPLVLGANIGTTLKFWFISWLGFSVDLTTLILPLAALSLPLFLLRRRNLRPVLYFSFGFILLFTGLYFIRQAGPDLTSSVYIRSFISSISGNGFISILLFVGLGFVLTSILQSSSATMTLTVVLAYEGIVGYESAVAMVLGENIGTTVTALLAAVMTNRQSKNVAFFHSLFNVVSVSITLLIFGGFTGLVWNMSTEMLGVDSTSKEALPFALTMFHTTFNFGFALLFLPFTNLIYRWLFSSESDQKNVKVKKTDYRVLAGSEISLLHATERAKVIHQRLAGMFELSRKLFDEKKDEKYAKLLSTFGKESYKTGQGEQHLTDSAFFIVPDDLSREGNHEFQKLMQRIRQYADLTIAIEHLTQMVNEKNLSNIWFTASQREAWHRAWDICMKKLAVLEPGSTLLTSSAETSNWKADAEATAPAREMFARMMTLFSLMNEMMKD